ncbi:uncharacterized protein [Montipora capricornis]|uniref:uncharacterized protein isoform X1 n=1 Tax=Montipora capricornis TaxID=246305 RepID=UPI0035F1E7BC
MVASNTSQSDTGYKGIFQDLAPLWRHWVRRCDFTRSRHAREGTKRKRVCHAKDDAEITYFIFTTRDNSPLCGMAMRLARVIGYMNVQCPSRLRGTSHTAQWRACFLQTKRLSL